MKISLRTFSSLFFTTALIAGCVLPPSSEERLTVAERMAARHMWKQEAIPTKRFVLRSYLPEKIVQQDILTVYIEGDGLAWVDSETPSSDPTPRRAIGLELALAHPEGNAAYLGRPCQFLGKEGAERCGSAYWTSKRFSAEAVDATNSALDVLKRRFGALRLNLVGYSGGGAIAALVAAHRQDVELLVTVAGNIDTQKWAHLQRISPLTGSQNPAEFREQLARIKQVHLVGNNDLVVPPAIARSYAAKFMPDHRPEVREMKGYDHNCCWTENWQSIWWAIRR
jgi:pimeloyl-ACP methyl ester carboxylesterase